MASSGASSYAGSGGSSKSAFVTKRDRTGIEHDEQGDNLLDRRSSLEYGIFGVLFTLSKEKSEHRIRIRWVLLKILLDGWQLFTTVIAPEKQGWSIDPNGTAWAIVGVLNFTWLGDLGYSTYLAVLYSVLALLSINIVMCIWVAWCFKEHKFPVVWPIKVLRVFSSVFFQAFDVASLNLLQLGLTCRFTGPETPKLHVELFPEYSCTATPHIMHAVVSALCLVLFVAIALLLNMAEVEVNPLSRRPMALGHSGAEVMAFGIKVMMTLVNVFLGWKRVQACVYLALALALAWQTLRWSPHLVTWVNYLKSGVSITVVWCAAVLTLFVFNPRVNSKDEQKMKDWADVMTFLMLAGLAPSFVTGALISWASLRRSMAAALKGLDNPKKLPLIEAFTNIDEPRDVEVASRYCRSWKEPFVLDLDAANKAHMIIKAGLEMFPNSAFMVLLHANFMIDVLGVNQSGSRRIEDARKLNPSLMCRFIMFVRQQQATQHAAGSSVSATMDLLGYVEYQRKQRMVVRLHREALQAMCNFWKALDASSVSFTHLSKSLAKIDSSVSQAQRAYRVVLESYGNNPKLVHLYGKFLQTIKNDPWHAAEYFAEAERLEELQDSNAGGPLMPDGTPLSRMDEIDTSVLVLNATGEVQMANRHTQTLFGYKRGVLEGKPLTTLLAPHYARRLADRLASIATTQGLRGVMDPDECAEMAEEMVVGLHSDRLAFPAKLSLRKASGIGEDSTIIALIEPVPTTPGVSSAWVTQNGIITACDPSFVSNFGWKASEVNGTNIKSLLLFPPPQDDGNDSGERANGQQQVDRRIPMLTTSRQNESATEVIKRLLAQALVEGDAEEDGKDASRSHGMPVLVPHKYLQKPVECSLTIVASVSKDSPIVHEVRIKVDTEPVQLLAVNRKGAILHASAELAARLKDRSATRLGALTDHDGAIGIHVHSGIGHMAHGGDVAIGEGGAPSSSAALNGYTLFDFLSPAWKEMHFKLLKEITTVSPMPVAELTCRKTGIAGSTLELRTAGGREIYMRVGVTTTEVQGDLVHIVHMARSSPEAALAERRLRLSVSPEGLISAVESGNVSQLFGLEASKIVGRGLWEVVEELDKLPAPTARGSSSTLLTRDTATLIKRVLKYPGRSWRVQVMPPPSRAVRISFTQQAKPAIMQVHVAVPANDDEGTPTLLVDLWPLTCVVGVLELDQSGRVRAVLEERTRPAGLLFGVANKSLVGRLLGELVAMPPGHSKPGDLLFLHGHKKSSLKSQAKESSVKVGPIHVLRASHLDGRPLSLDVQVIGKPGSNEPTTAILRAHQTPMMPVVLVPQQPPGGLQQQPPKPISPQTAAPIRAAADIATRITGTMPPMAAKAPLASGKAEKLDFITFDADNMDAASTKKAGMIARQRTPSPEDTKPRVPSPWRPQRGTPPAAPQPPPVVRALSTPPAARQAGSIAVVAEDLYPMAGLSPAEEVQQDMGPESAGDQPGTDTGLREPHREEHLALSRNKLADLVKSVKGDQEGNVGSRHVHTARSGVPGAEGGSTKINGGSARLVSPAFKRGQGRLKVPGSVNQVDDSEEEDERGSWENGAGASEGAASESDDHGAIPTKGRTEKVDRVMEWVASKGAFYQNSVPGCNVKGDDISPTSQDGYHRGYEDSTGIGSPPGGVLGDNFVASPMSSNGAKPTGFRLSLGPSVDDPPGIGLEDDDGGSDGGQSAVSGAQSATGSEYTRGKRFRKLAKLMDSSQTQLIQKRLRVHSLVIVGLLAVLHIVCFVITISAIKRHEASMVQLGRSGQAQLFLHRIMIDVRSLDVISKGKELENLYTSRNTQYFIQRIARDAEELKVRFNEILNTHSTSDVILNLLYQTKRTVWDTNDADGSDMYVNLTIWDFATRFYSMAKQVEQLHGEWTQNNIYVADSYAGQFLLKSGPDLFVDSRRILDALLYQAVSNARRVDVLQIVFLVVEGAAISFLAACYIMYLLRAVAAQRFKLYSTFLVIPVGLTRALASQTLNLLVDEDEDDDGEDEEDRTAQAVVMQETDAGTTKLRRRATLKVEESTELTDPVVAPGRANGRPRRASEPEDPSDRKPFMDRYDMLDKQRTLTADSISLGGQQSSTGCWGRLLNWRVRLRSMRIFRRGSILPMPMLGSTKSVQPGHLGPSSPGSGKRSLKFDSHETLAMLLPFLVWSAMVITIYAVAVVRMQGVDEVVAVHSVVNFMSARTSRTVFFCQELASTYDPSKLMANREALLRVIKLVRDAWYTLQLGEQAYTAVGTNVEIFPLVKAGLSHTSKEIENLFYSSGTCHRIGDNLPCPGRDYRFYQICHTGLDSMMQQLMISLSSMATNSSMVPEGLEDEHFDFVYNVGYKDLLDGTLRVSDAHYTTILLLFQSIMLLHIALFLLFWVIFGGFLMFMLNPLLRRIGIERRRIAELMSQLPLELDVERLVARALGEPAAGHHNGVGGGGDGDRSTHTIGGAGGNTSGNERAFDGTNKWKAIIRASTSLNGKGSSMDGRRKAQ